MYEPKDKDNPEYFSFRYISGQMVPGYGIKQAGIVALVLAIGILLFVSLGSIETVQEVELTQYESVQALGEYKQFRNQLYSMELEEGDANVLLREESHASYVYVEESEKRRKEILKEAEARGIESSMTDAELEEIIPSTKEVLRERFPLFLRIIFCLIAPVMITASLFFEFFQGFTLEREIRRWIFWRAEQKVYRYRSAQSESEM